MQQGPARCRGQVRPEDDIIPVGDALGAGGGGAEMGEGAIAVPEDAGDGRQVRPHRLLATLALGIGIAEIAIMILLESWSPASPGVRIAVDAGILLAVAFPLLYHCSFRPLRQQIRLLTEARDLARRGEAQLAEAQRVAGVGHWELDLQSGRLAWSAQTCRIFGRRPEDCPPGRGELLELIVEEDRPRVRSTVEQAAASGAAGWQCAYRVLAPDGRLLHLYEEAATVFDGEGRPKRQVGTVQDVTALVAAQEAARREELLTRPLVTLHEQAGRVDLNELFAASLAAMVRLTGSAFGHLFLFDERTGLLSPAAGFPPGGAGVPGGDAAPRKLGDAGFWGEPVRQRRGVMLDDCTSACRDDWGLSARHAPLVRHLSVPVLADGKVVAAVGVGNKGAPYDRQDESRLALFALEFWEIVRRKRREEEMRAQERSLRLLVKRLADVEEQERRRIAVELHDTLVQDLAAVRLRVAALQADEGAAPRRAELAGIAEALAGVIGYARTFTYELSSPLLHQFGIEAALPWLVEETGRRHGLKTRCDCTEALGLPREQGVLLYRIAQELLRNVVKHAGAASVHVRLGRLDGGAVLVVEDDGRGFAAPAPRSGATASGGFGLFSIRERLRDVGGAIRIEPGAGGGSRVTVTIGGAGPRDPAAA